MIKIRIKLTFLAVFTIICFAFSTCDNGNISHSHFWQLSETKAPTITEDGEETYTCSTCGEIDKRPIPATGPQLIITPPDKIAYENGEAFQAAGLAVHVSYGNHQSSVFTYTLTLNGFPLQNGDIISSGVHNITVNANITDYGVLTASFIISGAIDFLVTNSGQWVDVIDQIREGADYQNYNITISGNVDVDGFDWYEYTFGDRKGIIITLNGNGKLRLISYEVIIRLNASQTLIIDDQNLTLEGVIQILENSRLFLTNGKIGGVDNEGTFTMNGGEINSTGVYNQGTFIMNGGDINSTGVRGVHYATFTMNGGRISGSGGSGYVIAHNNFIMNGGEISGNLNGGKVSVHEFIMTGGSISNNTGDVSASNFTMTGGSISNNTGYVDASNFTMTGGSISNNTGHVGASNFTMTGGTVSNNSDILAGVTTLSGNATINNNFLLTLSFSTPNPSITIDSGWTGSVNGILDLSVTIDDLYSIIFQWLNRPILKAAASHTLTLDDLARVTLTLGDFVVFLSDSTFRQPITQGDIMAPKGFMLGPITANEVRLEIVP